MNITIRAWDHIEKIVPAGQVLRIGIRGGGCSGLSYHFSTELSDERQHRSIRDVEFENSNGQIQVVVDGKSHMYLKAVTLDYEETLMRQGFVITNPDAKQSCGCGSSFSV